MNLNRPPRWIRWFLYYTVILSIPVILGIAIYFQASRIIEKNSGEIYAAALEHARFEADMLIQTVTQTLDHLIANRNVQKLSFMAGPASPDDVYSMYILVEDLKSYHAVSPVIDDIFIVLNNTGTVLGTTGTVYRELYFNTYYHDKGIDAGSLAAYIAQNHRLDVLPVGERFLFLRSTLDSNYSTSTITAAVAIKKSRFIDLFGSLSGETATYIFNSDGGIAASSRNALELPAAFDPASPGTVIKKDGRLYYPMMTSSHSPDWRYLCLIPMEAQRERVRQIQLFSLACLLICSFFSIFFSFRMTRDGYNTQMTLRNNLQILRKFCIYTLLEKPWDNESGPEEIKKYQIEFPGEKVMVIFFVLSGEDTAGKGKVLSEREGNRISLLRSNLIRIFQERAGRHFHVEMTDVGENTAAILNWSGSCDPVLLEDDIEETRQDLESQFRGVISAALGGEYPFPEGIYASSLEASETLLYLDASSGQSILHYHDIRNPAGRYQFPPEMEQKLISLIRYDDDEAACLLVRQLFELNTAAGDAPGVSGPMIRVLAADILGAVMKVQGPAARLTETDLSTDTLILNVSVRELAPSLERIIRETCAKNRAAGEKKAQKRLGEKIQSYICENYRNPDINISQTGYHFEMSPFYLSRIFKEETGTGLLEFINTLRVEEGKKLLAAGNSITRTAELTGFHGSNAFIRVFKKMTGVTPGQYKDLE